MTPPDDHSQQRQPLFYPVVIATVLLTIIGMVGGYLLAEQRGNDDEPEPDQFSAPTLIATGPPCLEQTQKMGARAGATGELREVLRVRTRNRTEAWICEDQAAKLYYHANSDGAEARWIEGETALFLPNVYPDGAGGFEVEALDGNRFALNKKRLLIRHTDGRTDVQKVVPE